MMPRSRQNLKGNYLERQRATVQKIDTVTLEDVKAILQDLDQGRDLCIRRKLYSDCRMTHVHRV